MVLAILKRVVRVAKDWGAPTCVLKLDIKKAFDSVSQVSTTTLIADKAGGLKPGDPTGQPWEACRQPYYRQETDTSQWGMKLQKACRAMVRQESPDSPVVFAALRA